MTQPGNADVHQSRLLKNLLAEASSTRDLPSWGRAICQAAAHEARAGMLAQAPATIKVVREAFGPSLHPDVACWLFLAEGILHWCKFEVDLGYGRIIRAHALAVALGSDAAASCAAWMALLEFNAGQYPKMAQHLSQAFEWARKDDHLARGRATLTLACAYHSANRFDLAGQWYEQARRHCTTIGDEATLGAMLHNVAIFRLANIRFDDAFGQLNEKELLRAGLEAGGSATFDIATGNRTHESLRFLMLGQLRVSERKFDEALKFLDGVDVASIDHQNTRALMFIERAWCMLQLGQPGIAWDLASLVQLAADRLTDDDDRAYVYARLSGIAEATNRPREATGFAERAATARAAHLRFREEILETLVSIRATPAM